MRGLSAWVGFQAVVMVCVVCPPAWAQQGTTERVSVSLGGGQGNSASYRPSISSDGRFVAFESYASNLVLGDTYGYVDVFVRDRQLGTTERVSVSSGGDQAMGDSTSASISADGRFVAFDSGAFNLVAGDTNGYYDVFVRDRLLGTTELVSVSSSGQQANSGSDSPTISADGRFVAFMSSASNLIPGDTYGYADVLVRDRLLGTTERVSVSSTGDQGNGDSGNYGGVCISADGRLVGFMSSASNLVPGDTNGVEDVFVRDRLLGTTERVSVSSSGEQGDSDSGNYGVSVSADGRFVAFDSVASKLVPGDTNGYGDVFVRDRLMGKTERVSVASSGEQGNNSSEYPFISTDGRFVAFWSWASGLVPGDTNGCEDVFVRDRLSGTTERVSVSSTREQGNNFSYFHFAPSISTDRRFVVFDSASSNLVPGDTNGYDDVFVHQYGPDGGWPTVSGSLAANTGVLPSTGNFEFRQPGQTQPFGTWSATLGADGSFTVPAPVGVFDLSVKVTHWLRKTSVDVDTSAGSADVGTLALINGDATGDNRVSLLDLGTLLRLWQTSDAMADLDGNGLVGIGDLSIVLRNFNQVGDP